MICTIMTHIMKYYVIIYIYIYIYDIMTIMYYYDIYYICIL